MSRRFWRLLLVTLMLSMTVTTGVMQGELGSPDNPIQIYFVPSVEPQVIINGADVLSQALTAATGYTFEVFVPTSYAETIEAMCAASESGFGFLPAAGYVIANQRCGVTVGAAAVRRGWPVYWGAYIVRRDSGIYTLGDLAGRSWAYPDANSTSGFIVPSVELQFAGIEPGERIEAGGHDQVVTAVYNGDAEFGTTFFSPPLTPGAAWALGDPPEPYDMSVLASRIGDDGNLYVGDIRILDARSNVREALPDVVEQVRVLRLTEPIPNDSISFGAQFPPLVRDEIIQTMIAFSQTDGWAQSIGSDDFYGWSSLEPIEDTAYDPVRLQFEVLGLTEQDVLGG